MSKLAIFGRDGKRALMQPAGTRFSEDVIANHENSITFSTPPQELQDDPADVILEQIARALDLDASERALALSAISDGIALSNPDADHSHQMLSRHEAVAEVLYLFATIPNGRLVAHAMLLLIGRNPYSEVQIAQLLGVTKAAVSKVKVELQQRYSIKTRCGRSAEARERFSTICKTRAQQKEPIKSQPWAGASLFRNLICQGR